MMKTHNPPWPYTFVSDGRTTCIFCLQADCSVLMRRSELDGQVRTDEAFVVGICEACVLHAHWVWRTSPGEAPPAISEAAVQKVSRVKVVLARRRPVMSRSSQGSETQGSQSPGSQVLGPGLRPSATRGSAETSSQGPQDQRSATMELDAREDPSLVSSYDFAMLAQEEGDVDFPGCDLVDGESEASAALKSLEKIRVYTWEPFVESLYKAYTPRGRLVSVVLVTAWAMLDGEFKDSYWRAWPPKRWVAPGMIGFYAGFENAWSLRLFKRQSATRSTDEISVFVHEAAARYITLQQQLRSGERPQDLSMIEYLRKSMTDDEKRIDARLREIAEAVTDLREQLSRDAASTEVGGDRGMPRGPAGRSDAVGLLGGEDEDGASDTHEASGSPARDDREPTAGQDFSDESDLDDPDDDNDWPEDLPIRPGDEIVEAEFEEIAPEPPRSGFLGAGRSLDTVKKP